jgi:hypothetical protein
VIDALLAMPNFLLAGKLALRRAMAGRLPDDVLTRPKTALPTDPVRILYSAGNIMKHSVRMPRGVDAGALDLALRRYREGAGGDSTWMSALIFLPDSLANWMACTGASYE